MTISDDPPLTGPPEAYVWVWLPGSTDPVVAARLDNYGRRVSFTYGRSYLRRDDAIPLSMPDLPLRAGEMMPVGGDMAGCLEDSGPDSWGRRVIEGRLGVGGDTLSPLGYLLEAASDRIGAIDLTRRPDVYVPRTSEVVDVEEILEGSRRVEQGLPLSESLRAALLLSTSAGGARPKALVSDGNSGVVAKFPAADDGGPVVQAEYVAMELARQAGLNAAPVALRRIADKWVLFVERFDRTPEGCRKFVLSAQTVLRTRPSQRDLRALGSYVDLAGEIRTRFARPTATMRELFSRITFNILTGNNDDHLRNHAALWDGERLALTPAYDICPQRGFAATSSQSLAFGPNGDRRSQVARCIEHAEVYRLAIPEAEAIVDHQIEVIRSEWHAACDRAALDREQRDALWGREFLNPGTLVDYVRNTTLTPYGQRTRPERPDGSTLRL